MTTTKIALLLVSCATVAAIVARRAVDAAMKQQSQVQTAGDLPFHRTGGVHHFPANFPPQWAASIRAADEAEGSTP